MDRMRKLLTSKDKRATLLEMAGEPFTPRPELDSSTARMHTVVMLAKQRCSTSKVVWDCMDASCVPDILSLYYSCRLSVWNNQLIMFAKISGFLWKLSCVGDRK